jgi:hypothetical protein
MKVHVAKDPEKLAAILALLEERPYKNHELANLLRWPQGAVHAICAQLARKKLLIRLKDGAWSYPSTPAPADAPPTPPASQPGAALRQPHERPTSIVVKPGQATSWWVGPKTREEFRLAAAARHAEMMARSYTWRQQTTQVNE